MNKTKYLYWWPRCSKVPIFFSVTKYCTGTKLNNKVGHKKCSKSRRKIYIPLKTLSKFVNNKMIVLFFHNSYYNYKFLYNFYTKQRHNIVVLSIYDYYYVGNFLYGKFAMNKNYIVTWKLPSLIDKYNKNFCVYNKSLIINDAWFILFSSAD